MKQIGIFGLAVPAPWGETQVSAQCYAAVTEELARGWMSMAGAMGGHTVVGKLIATFGTREQQDETGRMPSELSPQGSSSLAGGGPQRRAQRGSPQRP